MTRNESIFSAVIGAAGVSLALYLYYRLSPAEKRRIEEKLLDVANTVVETAKEFSSTLDDQITDIKHTEIR